MPSPDDSQTAFCRSPDANIRLLAPAGCGKTFSLLHRCRELAQRATHRKRFLIVTFTRSATAELKDRLATESSFEALKGVTNVTTLNAYGWNRIRSQVSSPRLLTTKANLFFAMKNQLHPLWSGNKHLEHVVTKPGPGARTLMTVMDNMKSLGFVHARDLNRETYNQRLDDLEHEGLSWRITEQFELLTRIGVLDSPHRGDTEGPSTSRRQFYDRFFTFWRRATDRLLEESTFTFEDQKYWTYLDLTAPTTAGKPKAPLSGGVAPFSRTVRV